MNLFTYTIPVDDGAAPNPFGGFCTLTICKPAIRRTAQAGDWIAGFGSRNAPSGDLSGRLVYAMRVTKVIPMKEYDRLASFLWPSKIPDVTSKDLTRRLGDCIYDFSTIPPTQRIGVHGPANVQVDLGGRNAFVSDHFFYFGSRAIVLPDQLRPILHETQGHKSLANTPYIRSFLDWIGSLHLEPGQLYGWPDYIVPWSNMEECACRSKRVEDEKGAEESVQLTDDGGVP